MVYHDFTAKWSLEKIIMKRESIKLVALTLMTSRRFDRPSEVSPILTRLCAYEPLIPEKWGICQPIDSWFASTRIDEVANAVAADRELFWERKKPKTEGSIRLGTPSRHFEMELAIWDSSYASTLTTFLRAESLECGADLGGVELQWPGQAGSSNAFYERKSPEMAAKDFDNIGCTYFSLQVRRFLPQLQWATVFGRPYVNLFGREKLLSAPAAVVEELGEDTIFIQLTPKVTDVANDLEGYFALRSRVKDHIGSDAFFDPAKGPIGYRVPEFGLEVPHRRL